MVNTAFNVALRAVALGAEHIPDKVFESLPGGYFKAKEKREKREKQAKEHRRARKPSRRDSHHTDDEYTSDYYTSGDEDRRRESRRAERREQERRRRARSVGGERHERRDDGWDPEKDFGRSRRASQAYPYDYRLPPHAFYPPPQGYPPQAYPAQPYAPQAYPPPPPPAPQAYPPFPQTYASPPAQAYPPPPPREYRTSQEFDPYKPRPYNPADHATPVAAAAAAGATAAQGSPYHQPVTASPSPPRQTANPYENYTEGTRERRPSVAEIRYRPVNYTPSIPSGSASPHSAHGIPPASTYTPPHSAGLPPSNPYPPLAQPAYAPKVGHPMPPPMYRQPSYSQPPSRSSSQRGRHTARRHDRRTSLPRSFSGVREKFHNMNDDERRMAAGAVGAVAGGVLGHELVHSDVGTALGAAMGGLALRNWEKKKENIRSEGMRHEHTEGDSKGRKDFADREAHNDEQPNEHQNDHDPVGYDMV